MYKLAAIEGEDGKMIDTIKISSNPEKVTTPGLKRVYRIINKINHHAEGDYIALEEENPQKEEKLKLFHPVHTFLSKFVTDFEAIDLHEDIYVDGKLVYKLPTVEEIKAFSIDNLKVLWPEYLRALNPEEYPVDLSQKCWDNKMKNINEARINVEKMISKNEKIESRKIMHSMQSEIINKLLVQPEINPEVEFRKSVDMLKEYAKNILL